VQALLEVASHDDYKTLRVYKTVLRNKQLKGSQSTTEEKKKRRTNSPDLYW